MVEDAFDPVLFTTRQKEGSLGSRRNQHSGLGKLYYAAGVCVQPACERNCRAGQRSASTGRSRTELCVCCPSRILRPDKRCSPVAHAVHPSKSLLLPSDRQRPILRKTAI